MEIGFFSCGYYWVVLRLHFSHSNKRSVHAESKIKHSSPKKVHLCMHVNNNYALGIWS